MLYAQNTLIKGVQHEKFLNSPNLLLVVILNYLSYPIYRGINCTYYIDFVVVCLLSNVKTVHDNKIIIIIIIIIWLEII